MPKLSEFFQQIVNDAWDEKPLPSGRHIDKTVQTLMRLFFFCLVFVSFCFNQGHSTVSWKKTKGTTNAHQAQKCQDKRKIEGKKSLRKLFKTVLKKKSVQTSFPQQDWLVRREKYEPWYLFKGNLLHWYTKNNWMKYFRICKDWRWVLFFVFLPHM